MDHQYIKSNLKSVISSPDTCHNDGQVVPSHNTDDMNGIFGDSNDGCSIEPADNPTKDADVPLVDVSNNVDGGNVDLSFDRQDSTEDVYTQALLRDIEEARQKCRKQIPTPVKDRRCPIALSPEDDKDLTEDEINVIASKLKRNNDMDPGIIKRCPIGIDYELMIHNSVKLLYDKIIQKRKGDTKNTGLNIENLERAGRSDA